MCVCDAGLVLGFLWFEFLVIIAAVISVCDASLRGLSQPTRELISAQLGLCCCVCATSFER